jgi:hypothetical protein
MNSGEEGVGLAGPMKIRGSEGKGGTRREGEMDRKG